jgi:3-isopropylmalate dehydrogenase
MEAAALESAVNRALGAGARTADISESGARACSTREAGTAVLERLKVPA